MHQFIRRKSVISILFTLTLIATILGTVVMHSSAHAQAPAFHAYNAFPIKPLTRYAQKISAQSASKPLDTPSCLTSATPPRCYSPEQIRTAYGIQPLFQAGIRGAGQTVVVIAAATSPSLQSDVHLYDQLFGLNDPKINIFSPFDTPSVDSRFYGETILDIETVHSIAPDATIDVVLANEDNITSPAQFLPTILPATRYAIEQNLGGIISQSFGIDESCASPEYIQEEQQVFEEARQKNITVLAGAGDTGAAEFICDGSNFSVGRGVELPAADPLVTGVGGTKLDAKLKTGQYISETTWNEDDNKGGGATGGGISTRMPVPDYQKGIAGLTKRGVPDVAFNSDNITGVPIVLTVDGSTSIEPIGGTSVASPSWAAIVALTNQLVGHRLGFLNPALYAISTSRYYTRAFHDIKTGNNSSTGFDINNNPIPVTGYDAGPGWDAVTGVGTPNVLELAPLLAIFGERHR